MYEILKTVIIILAGICGLAMAIKPEMTVKKEWRDNPQKLLKGRILGGIIFVGCILLVIWNYSLS